MNSKKKFLSFILSALFACSFSLTTFAAEAVPVPAPVPTPQVVAADPTVPSLDPLLSYSGAGDSVVQNVVLPAGAYKVTMNHDGQRNFAVKFYDVSSKYPDLIANTIGAYTGTALLSDGNLGAKQGVFEVKADGNWTIKVYPITNLSTTSMTGTGDKVTGLFVTSSTNNVLTIAHTGEHHFSVWSHDEKNKRNLLANTIGEYNGQVVFQTEANKAYYLEVSADGDWLITFGVDPNITTVTD